MISWRFLCHIKHNGLCIFIYSIKNATSQVWLKIPKFPTSPPLRCAQHFSLRLGHSRLWQPTGLSFTTARSAAASPCLPLTQGRQTRPLLWKHYQLDLHLNFSVSLCFITTNSGESEPQSLFLCASGGDVESHSDSTWSFSLPLQTAILRRKSAKLHVNNAGRCSKTPKETLSSLRIQVNQTFSHFFFVRERRRWIT